MKRLFMLAAMLAMTMAIPAYAQQLELTIGALAEGSPDPPKYQVSKEGILIIDGDVLIGCQDINKAYTGDPQVFLNESEREYAEACKKADFSPADRLPQTGGVPYALVPVVLLVSGGVLVRTVASR